MVLIILTKHAKRTESSNFRVYNVGVLSYELRSITDLWGFSHWHTKPTLSRGVGFTPPAWVGEVSQPPLFPSHSPTAPFCHFRCGSNKKLRKGGSKRAASLSQIPTPENTQFIENLLTKFEPLVKRDDSIISIKIITLTFCVVVFMKCLIPWNISNL